MENDGRRKFLNFSMDRPFVFRDVKYSIIQNCILRKIFERTRQEETKIYINLVNFVRKVRLRNFPYSPIVGSAFFYAFDFEVWHPISNKVK